MAVGTCLWHVRSPHGNILLKLPKGLKAPKFYKILFVKPSISPSGIMRFLKLFFCAALLALWSPDVAAFSSRTDFRDESIYFVMTTRFYDADATNNTQCWDGQSYNSVAPVVATHSAT